MKRIQFIALIAAGTLSAGFAFADGQECSTEKMAECSAKTKEVSSASCSMEKASCSAAAEEIVSIPAEGNSESTIVNVQYTDNSGAPTTYEIGSKVKDFTATLASTGEEATLSSVAGENATVLIFWNQACPWCVGSNGAEQAIKEFATEYKDKGVNVVFIDAGVNNDVDAIAQYANDNPEIPVFINRDSSLAVNFDAKYTPHTFILDNDMDLVYRGAFYTGNDENRRNHTQNAVNDMLGGGDIVVKEAVGKGCTIKWAEGSRPTT